MACEECNKMAEELAAAEEEVQRLQDANYDMRSSIDRMNRALDDIENIASRAHE